MKLMLGLLAAASAFAVATSADAATAYFTGSGTWGAGTATTAHARANSTFSFSFSLENPIAANPAGPVSDFSYLLDGVEVAGTPGSITFYTDTNYGLFDINFKGDVVSLFGADIGSDKSIDYGTYAFTAAPGTGFPGKGTGSLTVSATAAVPEPASWAMMIGGFGLVGASLRRRQRTAVRFA